MDNLKPIAFNDSFSAQPSLTKLCRQIICFKWYIYICLFIPFLTGSANIAHAQLTFVTKANSSSVIYTPYNPGTGPGEIGTGSTSPGAVNNPGIDEYMASIAGYVSFACTNQFIPDATITVDQSITVAYNLPAGGNPDQNEFYTLFIDGGTHNSATSSIQITAGPFANQIGTGYLGLEGEDKGGVWQGTGSAYVQSVPACSVTIELTSSGSPFASGGGNGNFSFEITGQAISPSGGTGPGGPPTP